MEKQINNRLHRSGAIDFNCSFDVNSAQNAEALEHSDKRAFFKTCRDKDGFSVCEGEPLFTQKKKARIANHNDRFNMTVMSSVNASLLNPVSLATKHIKFGTLPTDPPEWLKKLNEASTKPTTTTQVYPEHMLQLINDDNRTYLATIDAAIKQSTGLPDDKIEQLKIAMILHTVRQSFFSQYRPTGVSVSKWNYEMLGRQSNEFVATLGGLNTIYVDENVQAGDTLIVDLPFSQIQDKHNLKDAWQKLKSRFETNGNYGFCEMCVKKGCPHDKMTLVVRSMPQYSGSVFDKYLRQGFVERGQVLGMCVKSAQRGERGDIGLASNAIGMRNNKDNPFTNLL